MNTRRSMRLLPFIPTLLLLAVIAPFSESIGVLTLPYLFADGGEMW